MARGRRNLDENAAPYESPTRGTIKNLMALKKQKGAVHRPIIFVEKERSPLLKKVLAIVLKSFGPSFPKQQDLSFPYQKES